MDLSRYYNTNYLSNLLDSPINNFTTTFPLYANHYPYITNSLYNSDETSYTYKINMPGMSKDNVNVSISNGFVTIKAEKTGEGESTLLRRFNLPEDSDQENISASVENGVFKMIVQKKAEEEESVRIIDVQ